jgi:ATP-dependent helicase HrpA
MIKIMTDGILLAELQQDRDLSEYDTLIVDEAHERSLNIDFVLGVLKTLLPRRKDLKLIITSATIDTAKFSQAFDGAPVIEVSGRMYPVEVKYFPHEPGEANVAGAERDEMTPVEMAVAAVRRIAASGTTGDILVFMPTEQDIRETCEILEGQAGPGCRVMPLYARLSAAEQGRVFGRPPGRKIIVSTNVAETSLTIPGIRYVVDTGLARIAQYNPRSRTTALPVVPVSRSSADQRAGRCGRVEDGLCVRLFSESDYVQRPLYTPPEILRSNLAEVILRMTFLHLGDIAEFPFIDRPASRSIQDGYELLKELGAIEEEGDQARNAAAEEGGTGEPADLRGARCRESARGPRYRLTRRGHVMARLPVDPRLSRMLIEARQQACLEEVAILAAALSIPDPRERPAEKAAAADRVQAVFRHPESDFLTLLNIWYRYQKFREQEKTTGRLKKFCRDHFLSFRRMREWGDIYDQLKRVLAENGWRVAPSAFTGEVQRSAAIHRSVLSGFLSSIGVRKEKNVYRMAKGREAMIFPGSTVFNRAGEWIVASELVETARLFARTVAVIEAAWLEALAGKLCKSIYLNPRWDSRRGEVVATEQVSLFGLVIVTGRTVSFGRIEPEIAAEVFVRSALVEEQVERWPGFLRHNRRLVERVRDMEDRLRRRDILVDEAVRCRFYRDRLGQISNLKDLNRLIRKKGGDQFLRMTLEDLVNYRPDPALLERLPDGVTLGGSRFRCAYRFEPGKPEDGVTVHIPAVAADTVPPHSAEWLVPGLRGEKIEALLKGLPKGYRKRLQPLSETVALILAEMPCDGKPLVGALGEFIHKRFGVNIPASAWNPDAVPDYLKMRFVVTGPGGEILQSGRDLHLLRRAAPPPVPDFWEAACKRWEKTDVTDWDFGELPETVRLELADGGTWEVFPALSVKRTEKTCRIDVRLFRRREDADAAHSQGLQALCERRLGRDFKKLKKSLALPRERAALWRRFGGASALEQRICQSVLRRLLPSNIRNRRVFLEGAEKMARQMVPLGREILEQILPVLEAYDAAAALMLQLQNSNRGHVLLLGLLAELDNGLGRLVPENFMELYPPERLAHLPRYLRAVEVRARRAAVNFEKDQAKAATLKPFMDQLEEQIRNLRPTDSSEKRLALEDFFWLIEEYRVSLFAQELRTAVPISEKRLAERLEEIRRMA